MKSKELIEYINNHQSNIIANFRINNISDHKNFIIMETELWKRAHRTSHTIIKEEYMKVLLPDGVNFHIKRDGDEDMQFQWQLFKIMVMCHE